MKLLLALIFALLPCAVHAQTIQCQSISLPSLACSPMPTPAPLTPSAYSQIVNGQPWPATFRPYCANGSPSAPCPWNDRLPDNPAQLYPNSAAIVAAMFATYDLVALPGDWSLGGDYNHPVYYASPSDPLVTVTCTAYCNVWKAALRIPAIARAAGFYAQSPSLDCHMSVIEPDGIEWDMYEACGYSGQAAFNVTGLWQTTVFGSGQGAATDGAALAAGVIRADELQRGVIPHALFVAAVCTTGLVYPGVTTGSPCASAGPPMGARLQLTLTDTQINALGLPAWEAAILHALHDYGAIVSDTSGDPSEPLGFRFESQTLYMAYGQPYPYTSMNLNIAAFDKAVDWAHDLRIVSPCYAQETCSQ